MDYPSNFETPTNPAGRSIAISRVMSIWTLIAFLIIIFLCGILVWSARSDKLVPFLIKTDSDTGEWSVVGRTTVDLEYSTIRTMQESVISGFTRDWFRISANPTENNSAWQKCERNVCTAGDALMFGSRSCSIYCGAGDEVYSKFTYNILPGYKSRSASGEVVDVDEQSVVISPAGRVSESGGTWVVNANVYSSVEGLMVVKIFIKVARNKNNYPQTMGFYIADFNAYRMN